MKNSIIQLTFLILLFSAATCFGETAIKAEVDKTKMTTDEALTYKLTISSTEKDIPQPQLPKFEGFSAVSSVQSSTVSFGKLGGNTINVYTLVLMPINIGKFKIEPSKIKVRDKIYETDAFEIEVIQGETLPEERQMPEIDESMPKITL